MLIGLWSPKGGSGVSVFATACALAAARNTPVTLVDCAGDQPAILGISDPPSVGVLDWLALDAASHDALQRIAIDAAPNLRLLAAGTEVVPEISDRGVQLAAALRGHDRLTIVDLGRARGVALQSFGCELDALVVVVRPCYLALRSVLVHPLTRSSRGVVLVTEPNRVLNERDVRAVLDRPILCTVGFRPEIARAVDAGLLTFRMPADLVRAARELLETIASWRVAA